MKHLDEYRDPNLADGLLRALRREITRPWTVMEVCGGQTHTLLRSGIDQLVPEQLRLIHGPGCPVCAVRAIARGRVDRLRVPNIHELQSEWKHGRCRYVTELPGS